MVWVPLRQMEALNDRLGADSAPPGNGGLQNQQPPLPSRGGSTPLDNRKCHKCGKVGHLKSRCPAQGGRNPRGAWTAKAVGNSISEEDAKVRGALDAAKEIIAEVPELRKEIESLTNQLENKEERDKRRAEELEAEEIQLLKDRVSVGGFHVKWRESNGDSPFTLGRLAIAGAAAFIGGASYCYIAEVASVTTRIIHLPAMLLLTPLISSHITGMSLGKSIFQGCIHAITAVGILVGADYYYSGFHGLRTCWAGGVFTDRRKKPIVREISFLKWGPKCPRDRRPDYATAVAKEHDPLLAVVRYKTTCGWKTKTKDRMVSMEILTQIANHANMTHMVSDEISAVKLDMAAGKIATVNFPRYSAHLTAENIISETARLAHAVRMAQLYRLERDDLPFYRPSSQ